MVLDYVTAGFISIDRFLQNRAPIFCLCFDGIGARHPGMTHHTPNRFSKLVVGCGSGPEQDPCSRYIPTTMSSGNRRHIPIAIKELIITLQTKKGLKKKQVADLLDINPRTVRPATGHKTRGRDRISCSGASSETGPRRLLNGIDCAVRRIYLVHNVKRQRDCRAAVARQCRHARFDTDSNAIGHNYNRTRSVPEIPLEIG